SLDFSLFPGTNITYPFLPDLLSGYLNRSGFSIAYSMIIPNILMLLAVIGLLMSVMWRIAKSVLASTLFPFLAVCIASTGSIFSVRWFGIHQWAIDWSNQTDIGI